MIQSHRRLLLLVFPWKERMGEIDDWHEPQLSDFEIPKQRKKYLEHYMSGRATIAKQRGNWQKYATSTFLLIVFVVPPPSFELPSPTFTRPSHLPTFTPSLPRARPFEPLGNRICFIWGIHSIEPFRGFHPLSLAYRLTKPVSRSFKSSLNRWWDLQLTFRPYHLLN